MTAGQQRRSEWMRVGVPATLGLLAALAMFGRSVRPEGRGLESDAAMTRLYARHGLGGEAQAAAASLVRRSGGSGYARMTQAAAAYHAGDVEAAVAQYRDLLEADPGAPVLLYNLGMALRRAGRDAEARGEFQRAEVACRGVLPGLADACRRAAGRPDGAP